VEDGLTKGGDLWYAVPSASDEAYSRQSNRPSPFGGAGGLSGERPPLDASDVEFDRYAEVCYRRSLSYFVAELAACRKPRRRRRKNEYSKRNCEEAASFQ